jgi:hypothetical protein
MAGACLYFKNLCKLWVLAWDVRHSGRAVIPQFEAQCLRCGKTHLTFSQLGVAILCFMENMSKKMEL